MNHEERVAAGFETRSRTEDREADPSTQPAHCERSPVTFSDVAEVLRSVGEDFGLTLRIETPPVVPFHFDMLSVSVSNGGPEPVVVRVYNGSEATAETIRGSLLRQLDLDA